MEQIQTAVFGGGCFWCTEAVFENLRGVERVSPGYAGGDVADPTQEQVSSGDSGHAEVVSIEYDPSQIKYEELLSVFFATHDPTTVNQQGNDVGPQYRSVIFYSSPEQKRQAEDFIRNLESEGVYDDEIVTEVKALGKFYEAEDHQHSYYRNNPEQPYCQLVITPKISKLRSKFQHLLKNE